jgi:signal transduction histidine kinase/ligand-binding sensor domain-containing protein
MKFTAYSRESGLIQSKVYTILQDRKGFLWFGTQDGLSRFDGYMMKTYKHDPGSVNSLGGVPVFTSLNDSYGNLWFGSEKGNFSKYIPESNRFINFRIAGKSNHKMENILLSSFCEDDKGNLIIGTYGAGLLLFRKGLQTNDPKDMNLVYFAGSIRDVSCLCIDKNGHIYIGTYEDGIYVLKSKELAASSLRRKICKLEGLSGDAIRSLHCDSAGRIIAGTTKGLNIIQRDQSVIQFTADGNPGSLSYNVVTSIAEDKHGRVWIATRNGGINMLDEKRGAFTHYMHMQNDPSSLPDNSFHSIFIDRTNVLWAGSVSSGVCKTDLDSKPFRNPASLNARFNDVKNINCIFRDSQDRIFIGTHNRGLIETGEGFDEFRQFHRGQADRKNFFPGNSIYSITETDDSGIWIGASNAGLVKFVRSDNSFVTFGNDREPRLRTVFSLCRDSLRQNVLLLGTDLGGLFEFCTEKKKYLDSGLTALAQGVAANSFVNSIHSERSGVIWFSASNSGLIRINVKRDSAVRMSETDARFSDSIRYIGGDGSGRLLICTTLFGLLLYDPLSGKIRSFTENEGLASNSTVSAVADDDGRIWVCTVNGLSKIDTDSKAITNYFESDNLLGREFNEGAVLKDSSGMIFVGGSAGLNYFFPAEIVDNPNKPVIAITDLQIFNRSVEHGNSSKVLNSPVEYAEEISLNHSQSVFSFEFASLIYNDPSKNQYAYLLEGFDKEWNYCGSRRFATYTNIESGEYVFKVRGTNNDGIWCEKPAELKVRISPPFWDTWWFKSAGVMTSALAAATAYRSKMKRMQKEKNLQDDFSRRLMESQESERQRIASDLHDTIAHDILVLKNKAYLGMTKEENPERLKNVLKEISDLSSEALGDVRSVSYNLHPHKIERLGLSKAIKAMLNLSEQSSGIRFEIVCTNIDNAFTKEYEINVYRILQELTNNIIRHSQATNAYFEIAASDDHLHMTVLDDGVGLSAPGRASEGYSGLGLLGIKTRVRLYGGVVEFRSPESGGTLVKISIPYKKINHETAR